MPNIFVVPRFPQGRAKAFTVSYDDATRHDIRLIEIMKRYGAKGTFNINSVNLVDPEMTNFMNADEVRDLYLKNGMEVACHAYHHPMLAQLPPVTALREVLADREALEKICGQPISGMAYPYGNYNDAVVALLRDAGISYCRAVSKTHQFSMPTDWLRLQPTCFHKDEQLDELTEQFVTTVARPDRYPLLYYVWGHSYELQDMENGWERIERLFSSVGGKEEIWYATNIEICRYMKAYDALEFTVDCHAVYNPSAQPVWISVQREIACVQPGEVCDLSGLLTDVKYW